MMLAGGGPPVHLPDNFSITFHRDGKKPGTVTVTRGDDKWEVKEDELNKLPDDVRPIAERMMGAGPFNLQLQGGPGGPQRQPLNQAMRFLLQNQPQPPGGPQGPNPPDGAPGPKPPPGAPGPQGGPPPRPGQPGQGGGDLMQRLEQFDRQLQLLQDELRGLRDVSPNPMPRARQPGQPQFGDEERQGPPGRGNRMGPPDGDRRGPPDGDRRGPPDGDRRGPPGDGERRGPPPGGQDNPPPRND